MRDTLKGGVSALLSAALPAASGYLGVLEGHFLRSRLFHRTPKTTTGADHRPYSQSAVNRPPSGGFVVPARSPPAGARIVYL